jgi:uncharacterized protein
MSNEVINDRRRAFLGTSALVFSSAVLGGSGMAAPHGSSNQSQAVKQPAVIGYPNEKGVTIERVRYPARNIGTTIVANLFKPARFDATRKYAAVVVTHPFGGVKEQTCGLYAQRLAEDGLITLAYDASYQEVQKKAKEPKELFVVDGATHIDLYDKSQFVTPAVAKLTAFFSQHLSRVGAAK